MCRTLLLLLLPILPILVISAKGNEDTPAKESEESSLLSIGDDLNIFFNGSAVLRYDTNVTRDDTDEIEDLLLIISPGIELNYGRGNGNITTIFGAHSTFYSDESRLDNTQGFFKTTAKYSGSRFSLNSLFSFREEEHNSNDSNVRGDFVRSRVLDFNVKGSYDLSDKIDLESGVLFSGRDYRNFQDQFNDRKTYSVPFSVYYAYSPKLDLSTGYRFRRTSVSGDHNSNDHLFDLGLRGELAPKLQGHFRAGYQLRDISGKSNEGQLSLDSDLTWAISPLTQLTLGVERDFDTGGQGESLELTGGRVSIRHNFSPFISAQGKIAYRNYDYDGDREDDNYSTSLILFYTPTYYLQFSLDYTYLENDSNLRGSSYRGHMLSLTSNVRY